MRRFFKKAIQYYLKKCVKVLIFRKKPYIIAITGTINKENIKLSIYEALCNSYAVRKGPKNYNAEIGIPLTIFDLSIGGNSVIQWLMIIIRCFFIAFFSNNYPEILILEIAISHPNDMDYILSMIHPDTVVITNITPKYADNFEDLDILAKEYFKLVKMLPSNGFALLNFDDSRQKQYTQKYGKIMYYGIGQGSDIRADNIIENNDGVVFNLIYNNTKDTIKMHKFGEHNIYAYLVTYIINNLIIKSKKFSLCQKIKLMSE